MVRVKPLSSTQIGFNEVEDVIIYDLEKKKATYKFHNPGDFYNVLMVSDSFIVNHNLNHILLIDRVSKKVCSETKEKLFGPYVIKHKDKYYAFFENKLYAYFIANKTLKLESTHTFKDNIRFLQSGEDGLLYMVSKKGILYSADSLLRFKQSNKFLSNNIDRVYIYNDISIASILNGGIIVSKEIKSNALNIHQNISCLSLDFDKNNPIVGSYNATAYKIKDGLIKPLVFNKNGRILKIFTINKNRYYLGDVGLIKEDTLGNFTYKSESEFNGVLKNYCIDSNNLYVAGSHGCFQVNVAILKATKQVYPERGFAIYKSGNTIWIGCAKGLLKNNQLVNLHTYNNIVPEISAIKGLNDSSIVVSTYNLGLFVIQNQNVRNITVKDGLNSNFCNDINIDKSAIWVASNFGVNRIKLNDVHFKSILIENFSNRFGYNIGEVFQIVIKDNLIYVATESGLFKLDLRIPESHIPIYVTHFIDSNTVIPIHGNSFQTASKNFQIPFESLKFNFTNANISYRYKFENEKQWYYTNIELIPFEHLKAGNYKLLIEPLINNIPIENNTTFVYLKILPTFFERTPVRIFLGLLILLLVILITYIIVRYFAKQNEVRLQLQAQSSTLELDLTRAQMKPHFIFNSLNSIYYYVLHGDAESAQHYLLKVAKLIRKSLYLSKLPFIALEDEIDFLDNYIAIEKLRFENKFKYKITVAEHLMDLHFQLPSLFLQPIVENAINHGLNYRKDGQGELLIHFDSNNNTLICSISDNGVGVENSMELKKKSEKKHISMGQNLVNRKIELIKKIYNVNITLQQSSFNSADLQYPGTYVQITFPILKQSDIKL